MTPKDTEQIYDSGGRQSLPQAAAAARGVSQRGPALLFASSPLAGQGRAAGRPSPEGAFCRRFTRGHVYPRLFEPRGRAERNTPPPPWRRPPAPSPPPAAAPSARRSPASAAARGAPVGAGAGRGTRGGERPGWPEARDRLEPALGAPGEARHGGAAEEGKGGTGGRCPRGLVPGPRPPLA